MGEAHGMSLACPRCGSTHTVKNGLTRHDKQNHRCHDCNRQFTETPSNKRISSDTRAIIDKLLLERLSLAGIARAVGVSETWLQTYVNRKLEAVQQQIVPPAKKGVDPRV
jgi:insertion element IS1 protein InsB